MENKIGVYICSGCGIGESMDLDALSEVASEYKAAVCRRDPFLCAPNGVSGHSRRYGWGRRQQGRDRSLFTAGDDGRVRFPA